MTATISSNPGKATLVSPDSGLSKVSSSKAKEVAPASAPEIINKTPATKIASSPAAVVSLGNSKSAGLDLYKKNGDLGKSDKKVAETKTVEGKASEKSTRVESKPSNQSTVKEIAVKAPEVKQASVKESSVKTTTTKQEQAAKQEQTVKNTPSEKTNSSFKAKSSQKSEQPTSDKSGDFIAGKGDVVVDVKASDSGYDNRIFYSTDNFKTKNYIGTDNQTGSVNLGKFKEGTKIQFGIDNGVGQFFKSGAASSNVDNIAHAKVTKTADGTEFGFEDLAGGGDNDFNDAIINVRNVATAEKKPDIRAPEVTTKAVKEKTNTNRSGLGDGTNPGRGAGTSNATNQGTNNPGAINSVTKLSKASAYTTKAVVESQLKVAV